MDEPSKEDLLATVNLLIANPDAAEMYSDLKAMLPVAKRLGARFTGERTVLNPLVDLWLAKPEKFGNVLALIDAKRAERDLLPLEEADEGFDKTEYMRDFMQQKRVRERRAAEIENMLRSDHDRLRGRARLDFMQTQANRWKEQRDNVLNAAREQAGRRLRKDELQSLLETFWQGVDRELDALEERKRRDFQSGRGRKK